MIQLGTTYVVIECANCHIHFAITEALETQLRRCHNSFYCPQGHGNHYPGQSDLDKLRAEKLQLESQLTYTRNQRDEERKRGDRFQASRNALRGVVTKQKNRIEHGVCIHCHRSFADLRRHMHDKHGVE
jgi:hypothetical protein